MVVPQFLVFVRLGLCSTDTEETSKQLMVLLSANSGDIKQTTSNTLSSKCLLVATLYLLMLDIAHQLA